MQIDVFVAGFGKCGTTTLCALLGRHPGIFVPEAKETWFFCTPDYDSRWAELHGHYAGHRPGQLLLDGTPQYSSYLSEDMCVERIHEHCPGARFIFIARDPKKRIESSFREMHHSSPLFGFDTPYRLSDALDMLPQMTKDSLYWERISKYRAVFGDQRILVVFLEDLARARESVLRACFGFLGLDESPARDIPAAALNAGERKYIDTRVLRWLRNHEFSGQAISLVPARNQDRLLAPLGLRRHFREAVHWDARARELTRTEGSPDAARVLRFSGKPADFWPEIPAL